LAAGAGQHVLAIGQLMILVVEPWLVILYYMFM